MEQVLPGADADDPFSDPIMESSDNPCHKQSGKRSRNGDVGSVSQNGLQTLARSRLLHCAARGQVLLLISFRSKDTIP